jgi:polysaccharide deacetylase 2 family uncharacterized protein YibQ
MAKTRKKRRKTPKKNSKVLTYLSWSLSVTALVLSALMAGYFFGYEEAQDDASVTKEVHEKEKLAILKKLEAKKEESEPKKVELSKEEDVKQRLKDVLKKPHREYNTTVEESAKIEKKTPKEILKKQLVDYASAAHEYDAEDEVIEPPKPVKREPKLTTYKPKLAIIIDDVSVKSHVKAIKALNIPLTMSFLPPSKMRPNSAKLAAKEEFYMVHLPMEAMNFNAEEPITLRINDSQQKISQRIDRILRDFPKVKYINNHTGSKFTSNEIAMNRLIHALNKHQINFVDSRTTAKTKVPDVMKNFGLKYVARDVFLDHHMEKTYVKKQIKEAIRIAKEHGSAVAIGHPHKNTLLALAESKTLFKEIELVYINKLN